VPYKRTRRAALIFTPSNTGPSVEVTGVPDITYADFFASTATATRPLATTVT
jgi:hypothetical protein